MEAALNDWDAVVTCWIRDDVKWIQAVLNLMEGDAQVWALPHLEELTKLQVPFEQDWRNFERNFYQVLHAPGH